MKIYPNMPLSNDSNTTPRVVLKTTELKKSCHQQHNPHATVITHHSSPSSITHLTETQFYIKEMDCPVEQNLIQKRLDQQPEIAYLHYNLLQHTLTVRHELHFEKKIIELINLLGFSVEIVTKTTSAQLKSNKLPRKIYYQAGLAVLLAGMSEAVHWALVAPWLMLLCAIFAILLSGVNVYKKGILALLQRNLNINALMSLAVSGAILLGYWSEAAMVMALFNIAELLESRSLQQAESAISRLLNLTPPYATVKSNGKWQSKPVDELQLGEILLIRPGKTIPVDGIVTQGQSAVDQSSLTGESLPVIKQLGEALYSGSINQLNSLEMQVTATVADSTLAKIIKTVERAQQQRAPTQKFIDKFSQIYTPAIVAIAMLTALLPPILGQQSWSLWLYRGLILLIIACPCALVISTPVTIISALTQAAKHGILIKGGNYLELLRKIRWLALDKTGTLTSGKPQQTDFISFDSTHETQQLSLLYSLTQLSEHPVSQAITRNYQQLTAFPVENFQTILGKGITGNINHHTYYLGNKYFIAEQVPLTPQHTSVIAQLENSGKTVVILSDKHKPIALCAVADQLKASTPNALQTLSELGVQTVMLTGDNLNVANNIAQSLPLTQIQANLLPEDKLTAINYFAQQGVVAMVGDGINDAPALARADISIAMGNIGSDIAISTAHITLMNDDLKNIPYLISLSKKTHKILIQNIGFSLGLKFIFAALTLIGLTGMWMAVIADVGVSLLVIMNGLRVLRH